MARRLSMFIPVLFAAALSAAASAQELPRLVGDLSAPAEGTREAAVHRLAGLGAEAVAPLSRTAAGEDHTAAAGARLALSFLVHRACAPGGDPAERRAVAEALLREVSGDYPPEHRRWLLRFVAFAGDEGSVPALAALLPDPAVGEMALFALARIPGEASLDALAAALEKAAPERRVGILLALARSGEARLAPVLLRALEDIDPSVRRAAREGLGKGADPDAVPLLEDWAFRDDGDEVRWSRDAYFSLAENLLASGRKDLALSLYELMFRHGPESPDRCAGLRGWFRAGAWDRVRVLVSVAKQSRALDPALAGTAVELLASIEGEEAGRALAGLAEALPSPLRIHLYRLLGRRGERAARPVIERGLSSEDPLVAAAAAEALGELGDPAAAGALAPLLGRGEERVREAAECALARLPGEAAAAAAAETLARAGKDTGLKRALIRVLGASRAEGALEPLRRVLEDPDPSVRREAIRALGHLDQPGGVPDLVRILRSAGGKDARAVRYALAVLHAPAAVKAVQAAFQGAPDTVRTGIVEALGRRGDPSLIPFFLEASRDPSLDVVRAALHALALTGKPSPVMERLLEAAESRWPEERTAALQALAALGTRVADRSPGEALPLFERALGCAESREGKLSVLSALETVDHPGVLELIRPLLSDPDGAVRAAAASAAAAEALALADEPGRAKEAVPFLEAVVKEGQDPDRVSRAAEKLRELGREVTIPVRPGYVRSFRAAGPLPGREALLQAADLDRAVGEALASKPVSWKGKAYPWKAVKVEHLFGRLNLLDAVADKGDVGVYLYTELYAPREMDARFLMGSDDDLFCWLNGKLVHRFVGGRGWRADQDRVDVHLKKGRNTVLLKVLNGAGGWDVSLKVTDRAGTPLDLEGGR